MYTADSKILSKRNIQSIRAAPFILTEQIFFWFFLLFSILLRCVQLMPANVCSMPPLIIALYSPLTHTPGVALKVLVCASTHTAESVVWFFCLFAFFLDGSETLCEMTIFICFARRILFTSPEDRRAFQQFEANLNPNNQRHTGHIYCVERAWRTDIP